MNESLRSIIASEAGEWFVANREKVPDARKSAAFSQWLRISPLHVEEYLALTQLAAEIQAARDPASTAEDSIEQGRLPISTVTGSLHSLRSGFKPRRPTHWLPLVGATVIVTGLSIGFWNWQIHTPVVQRYVTTHGQQSTYQLADNSTLRLNTDTEVVVRYNTSERVVEIGRGQAMFEVVHDARRPFRVAAGSAEVRDLGTAFDVFRQDDAIRVTVLVGQVSVAPSQNKLGVRAASWNTRVRAGEQVQVVGGVLTSGPEAVEVGRSTAWLRRQIAFEKQPLGEVAMEFNRYSLIPINIKTATLRNLRVSGLFAADDTESFIAFLRSLDGVSVEITPASIDVRAP